jgi:hypothetical protein
LDQKAIAAISAPVYGYLLNSAKGRPCETYFLVNLNGFFHLGKCTYAEAKALDAAYARKWPIQTNKISEAKRV